jgi:glutamate/tyrosine decarboxylase-like PLP-dependent enzyme
MLALDDKFDFKNGGVGAITNSVTESGFMSLNLAKYMKVKELNLDPFDCRRLKFVAYYPETNSSWAKKMLILKDINIHRALTVYMDEETKQYKIDNNELVQIIKEDVENGLIPLWYGSNFGSTDCCVIDEYEVVGPILKEHNIFSM